MAQSNGNTSLKRMEFVYGDSTYKFALNPEIYTQGEPSRTTVVQTKGGSYIDAWGAGMVAIEIKGTTGFKNGTGDPNNGFKKFTELRDLVRKVYKDVKPGEKVKNLMKFYNHTDEDFWYVYPDKFILNRDKSRSLLYIYDILLIGIAKLDDYDPLNPTVADTTLVDTVPVSPNLISSNSIETTDTNEAYEKYLSEHNQATGPSKDSSGSGTSSGDTSGDSSDTSSTDKGIVQKAIDYIKSDDSSSSDSSSDDSSDGTYDNPLLQKFMDILKSDD